MRCLYLAHPVSDPDPIDNCRNALKWLRFLRKHSSAAITAPWIAGILSGEDDSDPAQRARAIAECCELASRMDGVVLVGGRVSAGMAMERDAAIAAGRAVYDLTAMGVEPPAEVPAGREPFAAAEQWACGGVELTAAKLKTCGTCLDPIIGGECSCDRMVAP